jgi:hypothetical protein
LTTVAADRHTGVFAATFLDATNNHNGGLDFGGGQMINRPHDNRASIRGSAICRRRSPV